MPPTRVVYGIGDSLIGKDHWASQPLFHLRAMAGDSVRFKAQGISGDRTAHVAARLDRDVIEQSPKPDVCIVLAGTNDIAWDAPATLITGNLEVIYRKLLDARIQPVAVSIYPFGGPRWWTPALELTRQQVRTWMHRWLPVELPEVEVVDVDDVIADLTDPQRPRIRAEYVDAEGIHLNSAGAAAVASALWTRARALRGIQG
ncbi:MAG TPA: GDSL-type esterase/lipase family protein [Solirubrobacterales bacterium]|nr:GDSL-type esterase/lipase family protein [Solirubrobacterales bacterium]